MRNYFLSKILNIVVKQTIFKFYLYNNNIFTNNSVKDIDNSIFILYIYIYIYIYNMYPVLI
jgi:hypothetical protein